MSNADLLKMTNEIAVEFLTRNGVKPAEVADLMRAVHAVLGELAALEPPTKSLTRN